MFGDREIIVSETIVLRLIMPLDAEDIFNTIDSQRSYLGEWLPFVASTRSISDTENYINHMLNDAYNTDSVFTIRYKNKFAGIIGYKSIDELNHKLEIGYWLSETYQRKGIMTLSVARLCAYAYTKMDINRIQIKCACENIASKKIPQRLHFKMEGIERQGELLSSGSYTDIETYSLLKSEYYDS